MAEGMKWIKLATNIFDQGKIKLIMKMPAGDTIIAIWLQILTHCGKECQDGILRISNEVPYTADMLAMIFGRETATMKLALETFQRLKMIDVINGTYCLPNWGKYQSPDKYEIARAKDRKRLQEWRKKQTKKAESPQIETSSAKETFHETFQKRNETGTEIEEEVDKDKDKDITKNITKNISSSYSSRSGDDDDGLKTVIAAFQNNIHPVYGDFERDDLIDLYNTYGRDACLEAFKIASKHHARNISYIESVLRNLDKGTQQSSASDTAAMMHFWGEDENET